MNFIREKSNTFDSFRNFCIKLKNEKNRNIGKLVRIMSDHGKEFENSIFFFLIFATNMALLMNFDSPRHHNKMVSLKEKLHIAGNGSSYIE